MWRIISWRKAPSGEYAEARRDNDVRYPGMNIHYFECSNFPCRHMDNYGICTSLRAPWPTSLNFLKSNIDFEVIYLVHESNEMSICSGSNFQSQVGSKSSRFGFIFALRALSRGLTISSMSL